MPAQPHVGHTCRCASSGCLAMLINTEGGWVGMLVAGCTGVCRCGTRSVGRTCGCVCPPCVVDHWWTGCTINIVWHSGRLMQCQDGSLRWWWWGRGVGEASGGCCRGMLRTRPPVGTHMPLPLHTSRAITAITMHLCLLLGARGARLCGAGCVGGQCGRCSTSGMPP